MQPYYPALARREGAGQRTRRRAAWTEHAYTARAPPRRRRMEATCSLHGSPQSTHRRSSSAMGADAGGGDSADRGTAEPFSSQRADTGGCADSSLRVNGGRYGARAAGPRSSGHRGGRWRRRAESGEAEPRVQHVPQKLLQGGQCTHFGPSRDRSLRPTGSIGSMGCSVGVVAYGVGAGIICGVSGVAPGAAELPRRCVTGLASLFEVLGPEWRRWAAHAQPSLMRFATWRADRTGVSSSGLDSRPARSAPDWTKGSGSWWSDPSATCGRAGR